MFEIIKDGDPKYLKSKIKIFKCQFCTCEFKATDEHWKDVSLYEKIRYGAKCPCCNKIAYEII